ILSLSHQCFVDRKFKIAPSLFSQVFVILGCHNEGVHPCIYALLPNKNQATYTQMLVEIKNLSPGIIAGSISVDYELAIHNAFSAEFPNIEIRGYYRNNANFNLYARMITALAFVPPDNVVQSFEDLSEELERVEPTLQPILDWLEINYIDTVVTKTNNIAEASHRRLQAQLSTSNPTIWTFIIELKKVQAERDLYYEFLVRGNEPPPSKRKYVDAGNRILHLV
ncbi:THAP-type domain-containing protein, partial [Aphis craccivora]